MMKKIKYFIKKHKNRILSVCCSLLLIPILSFRTYAFDFFYNAIKPDAIGCQLMANIPLNSLYPLPNEGFAYEFQNIAGSGVTQMMPTFQTTWDIMWDTENYDYYASYFLDSKSESTFTFRPDTISIRYFDTNSSYKNVALKEFKVYDYFGADINTRSKGFRVLAKLPDDWNYSVRAIDMRDTSGGTVPDNVRFSIAIIQVTKNTSLDSLNAIVQAINNQTDELGNRIDGTNERIDETNDLVENGTEETQDNVSDFTEVFEDFNSELDNLTEFDDDIMTQFNSANTAYTKELKKFSLNSNVLAASTWLSSSMQHIYDNSYAYKALWLVPLLFGIPILLFIVKKTGDDE